MGELRKILNMCICPNKVDQDSRLFVKGFEVSSHVLSFQSFVLGDFKYSEVCNAIF